MSKPETAPFGKSTLARLRSLASRMGVLLSSSGEGSLYLQTESHRMAATVMQLPGIRTVNQPANGRWVWGFLLEAASAREALAQLLGLGGKGGQAA